MEKKSLLMAAYREYGFSGAIAKPFRMGATHDESEA